MLSWSRALPLALLFAGALALLLLAGGCDSLSPQPGGEAAPPSPTDDASPPLDWSLRGDQGGQTQPEGNGQPPHTCSGRVRLPEQAEKTWHPFDVTLHFPEEAVRAASGSTWTRTFKMRAASDPESTLLLEASCQFPASDAAQRRVARTAIEVREALRERFGKIPNDSPGAAATAGKGQATGREPTASSSSSSDCELEETYQKWNDTCDCWVSVYECKDGGDDDGSDTCDKNISTRAGAGDPCHDGGGGDGDGGGGGGGDETVASYCGSGVST